MSEMVKRCGEYCNKGSRWPQRCVREVVAGGTMCKQHEIGKKRRDANRGKFEIKYNADRAEDAKRKALFARFITEMDGSKAVKSGTLAVYNEIREHLRMQMVSMRGYVIGPQEKETK